MKMSAAAGKSTAYIVLASVLILLPLLVQDAYFLRVSILVLIYVIAASSMNIVVGYCGLLALGHAAFFGIGAYSAAMLPLSIHMSPVLVFLAAGAFAATSAAAIGWITLRTESHYFVLLSLSFAEVGRLIALNWVEVTNGPLGFTNVRPMPLSMGAIEIAFDETKNFYVLAAVVSVVCVTAIYLYVSSVYGRASVLIRENRALAQSVGVNVSAITLTGFIIAAFFAGVSGAMYAYFVGFVGPEVFSFSFTVMMLMMVATGGKGTILGPVIGAVMIVFAMEYLRFMKEYRFSVFGVMIILTVIFFPGGIIELFKRIRISAFRSRESELAKNDGRKLESAS